MTTIELKSKLILFIKNLKDMAEELEELYQEMDNLPDDEFDKRVGEIEDKYANHGIELFG